MRWVGVGTHYDVFKYVFVTLPKSSWRMWNMLICYRYRYLCRDWANGMPVPNSWYRCSCTVHDYRHQFAHKLLARKARNCCTCTRCWLERRRWRQELVPVEHCADPSLHGRFQLQTGEHAIFCQQQLTMASFVTTSFWQYANLQCREYTYRQRSVTILIFVS